MTFWCFSERRVKRNRQRRSKWRHQLAFKVNVLFLVDTNCFHPVFRANLTGTTTLIIVFENSQHRPNLHNLCLNYQRSEYERNEKDSSDLFEFLTPTCGSTYTGTFSLLPSTLSSHRRQTDRERFHFSVTLSVCTSYSNYWTPLRLAGRLLIVHHF